MKLFSALYSRVMIWSRHPHAAWYLAGLSFAESSFFPIPPDVMLLPMSLAKPDKALRFALITTLFSVIGGIFGYIIGWGFFEMIHPLLIKFGYQAAYIEASHWFHEWGFWAVLVAGFTPIPYKVFTIAAGSLMMPIIPFIMASFIGRGGRFFLVAILMKVGGTKLENFLLKTIDRLAIGLIILIVLGIIIWQWYK